MLEMRDCFNTSISRYAPSAEPAETVVRAVRAACRAEETAVVDERVSQLQKQYPTMPAEKVQSEVGKQVDQTVSASLLKRVMDARLALKAP